MENTEKKSLDFIRTIVADDVSNKNCKVVTRFPPEPNGYLHIGHAKAFCLNFSIAEEFGGKCHLRFDDTNPTKEEKEFVNSIQEDIRWLGWDWGENLFFASDYFEKMYEYAVQLIKDGNAYVDDQTGEQIRESRGSLTSPGTNSPFRNRSSEENLEIFEKMKIGEFPDGTCVLRAKIDMASPNLNLRDPIMYRILHAEHHRAGNSWCIYPMYDWAHGLEDSIEGITYSLCSLEFENHRPLYDWFLDKLDVHHPRQIEFARFNLSHTIMSKRKLRKLVEENFVNGWDDPRMPTLSGLRRLGYPPEAIKNFMQHIGINKFFSTIDIALLEHFIRQNLNLNSSRVMAVLNPLKVVIDNYPEDLEDELDAINNPEKPEAGTRKVPFSKVIYIEKEDFREQANKKFFRLKLGKEVRLRYAYFITANSVVKDENGEIIEVHCTYDPETRGGSAPDGRKVKGTLHWVSEKHAIEAEVRLYDHLFLSENPEESLEEGNDFTSNINPESLKILPKCLIEPTLSEAKPGDRFQFERLGYFCIDKDSSKEKLIFNRTVLLKDSWAKIEKNNKF